MTLISRNSLLLLGLEFVSLQVPKSIQNLKFLDYKCHFQTNFRSLQA